MAPAVSVIIPTKNRHGLLEETMNSILGQSFQAWEAVVVDDGSNDGTLAYLDALAKEDPRVRPLRREGEKGGAPVCRNQGFRASLGRYVVFLDSDDLLAPWCLEQRVALMDRNQDLDFSTWPGKIFSETVDPNGPPFNHWTAGADLDRLLTRDWAMSTPSQIWRRNSFESTVGLWDERLLSWQDVELHVRAIAKGCRYLRMTDYDFYVRWHDTSERINVRQTSNTTHLERALLVFELMETHMQEAGLLSSWARKHRLAGLYLFNAESWMANGEYRKAFSVWKLALNKGLVFRRTHLFGILLLLGGLLHLTPRPFVRTLAASWKWKFRLVKDW